MTTRPAPSGALVLVAAAMTGVFLSQLGVLMLGPLLVDMAADLGVEVPVAGQLFTFTALSWVVVAVLSGPISDAYGRKPLVLIGVAGVGLGSVGTGLAWDFGTAAAARVVVGLGGLLPPNLVAMVSDHVPARQRGKAVGAITAGMGIAGLLGVPAMTLVGEFFGWRWSFWASGMVAVAVFLLMLRILPPTPKRTAVKWSVFAKFKPLVRRGLVWELLLVNTCHRTTFMAFMAYFASFLISQHGFSTGQTALPMAVLSVGAILGPVVGGNLADTRYRFVAVPLGLAIAAATGLLVFVVPMHPAVAVALGLVSLTTAYLAFPVVVTIFSLLGGNRLRATAISLVPISAQGGTLLGPALGGLALKLGGYEALGLLVLVVAGLGALVSASRLRDHRVRATTAAIAAE